MVSARAGGAGASGLESTDASAGAIGTDAVSRDGGMRCGTGARGADGREGRAASAPAEGPAPRSGAPLTESRPPGAVRAARLSGTLAGEAALAEGEAGMTAPGRDNGVGPLGAVGARSTRKAAPKIAATAASDAMSGHRAPSLGRETGVTDGGGGGLGARVTRVGVVPPLGVAMPSREWRRSVADCGRSAGRLARHS